MALLHRDQSLCNKREGNRPNPNAEIRSNCLAPLGFCTCNVSRQGSLPHLLLQSWQLEEKETRHSHKSGSGWHNIFAALSRAPILLPLARALYVMVPYSGTNPYFPFSPDSMMPTETELLHPIAGQSWPCFTLKGPGLHLPVLLSHFMAHNLFFWLLGPCSYLFIVHLWVLLPLIRLAFIGFQSF